MLPPSVIESHIELEPVTSDPFIADLDRPASDAVRRLSLPSEPAPGRRIYD